MISDSSDDWNPYTRGFGLPLTYALEKALLVSEGAPIDLSLKLGCQPNFGLIVVFFRGGGVRHDITLMPTYIVIYLAFKILIYI